jgi:DNA polymerase delta subunit 4
VKKAAVSEPSAPKKAEVRTPSKEEEEEEEEVEQTPVEEGEEETPKEGEHVVEQVSAAPEPAEAESDEFEALAEKMTEAEIKKYWSGIMSARLAMPVHQEDLTVHEKILRYFDVSSQYGVSDCSISSLFLCLGIAQVGVEFWGLTFSSRASA